MGAPEPDISPLLSLLPYAIMLFVCFLFARRKGRSIGWAFVCLFPLGGVLVLFYPASLTDKKVLDRLSQLEAQSVGQSSGGA